MARAADAVASAKKAPGAAMLQNTRARTWVARAPVKNRTSPIAAAIPRGRTPSRPSRSPAAAASLGTASRGSQGRGTPTSSMLARTNLAGAGGADPAGLAGQAAVRATVLTPAHQYPRGMVLAARNRSAFVDWARREDGFIVEDEYDGEFRYDQPPVGAMQAQAPDRVVFAGSTSKTLAPGMLLGWLVVPAARCAVRRGG